MRRRKLVCLLALATLAGGVFLAWNLWPTDQAPLSASPAAPLLSTYEELTNSHFGSAPSDPLAAPFLRSIPVPEFRGASAVWGSTGRDARGHIWFGVSAADVPAPSAHLFEYAPESRKLFDRGDVVAELKRSGIHRDGESQMKIHSRIVQGADGHLYFTSMDEQGEKGDGSQMPTWGSHLWRVRLPDCRWEHLFAAPEGLIAVAGVGPYLYALGYHDHVLYQYEHATGRVRSTRVGAVGGHMSRNFLADDRGHAYVPRLKKAPDAAGGVASSLVEYNADLEEVAETPLEHYLHGTYLHSHGIVGLLYLKDRSMVFVTHVGFLYRVTPTGAGPSPVEELGWFHPRGTSYTPSLFSYDGERYLLGVSHSQSDGDRRYHWLVYDLQSRRSEAALLELPGGTDSPWPDLLLYGSMARDQQGNFYLGGARGGTGRRHPLLFQLQPGLDIPAARVRQAARPAEPAPREDSKADQVAAQSTDPKLPSPDNATRQPEQPEKRKPEAANVEVAGKAAGADNTAFEDDELVKACRERIAFLESVMRETEARAVKGKKEPAYRKFALQRDELVKLIEKRKKELRAGAGNGRP